MITFNTIHHSAALPSFLFFFRIDFWAENLFISNLLYILNEICVTLNIIRMNFFFFFSHFLCVFYLFLRR